MVRCFRNSQFFYGSRFFGSQKYVGVLYNISLEKDNVSTDPNILKSIKKNLKTFIMNDITSQEALGPKW